MIRRNNNNSKTLTTSRAASENPRVPSIRLIAATPSASGLSSTEGSTSISMSSMNTSTDSSWTMPSIPSPSPLAPSPHPRKRLVPKKSKLTVLPGRKTQDFSDVVRRVGGDSSHSTRGGFEIHVDDTEEGEIVMVKKKKSRAGLNGLRWGGNGSALGEVTNVPSAKKEEGLKVKDENSTGSGRWWSIGRGKKDEKEKEKTRVKSPLGALPPRSQTPQPFHEQFADTRARFNSLDSRAMLSAPAAPPNTLSNYDIIVSRPGDAPTIRAGTPVVESYPRTGTPTGEAYSRAATPDPYSRAATPTPTLNGLLAPSAPPPADSQGSIALRAIRSVRSLAKIGGWKDESSVPPAVPVPSKEKDKDTVKKPKKAKKVKKEKEEKRTSTSSFEAGALTSSPEVQVHKKRSILGIGMGWPTTMGRSMRMRSGSTATNATGSSLGAPVMPAAANNNNRLSVESAYTGSNVNLNRFSGESNPIPAPDPNRLSADSVIIGARTPSGSSSLRPISVASSNTNRTTSTGSVRWAESALKGKEKEKEKRERESKHSEEGRRRGALSEVFDVPSSRPVSSEYGSSRPVSTASYYSGSDDGRERVVPPLLTLETATSDGHSNASATPPPKRRPRPVSEQLLNKARPKAVYEEVGSEGVISMLDAATNDLAQLINHLDLEATPTPDRSLVYHPESPDQSPTRMTRALNASVTSLRPYAQSRSPKSTDVMVGQQIAPWPTLEAQTSQSNFLTEARKNLKRVSQPPSSPPPPAPAPAPATTKFRRAFSPNTIPLPEPSPDVVLKALKPSRSRPMLNMASDESPLKGKEGRASVRASMQTFGGRSGRSSTSTTSVRSSTSSLKRSSSPVFSKETKRMSKETKKMLGMRGTLGASDSSAYQNEQLDASDPDSDIPDELQVILNGRVQEDTLSYRPPSPPSPASLHDSAVPHLELPVFHFTPSEEDNDHDETDDATKKSFDFTGELQKLNESGASDRRSFVEQLENAFRTPAKIDLKCDFGVEEDIPPVPEIPAGFRPNNLQTSYEEEEGETVEIQEKTEEEVSSGFPEMQSGSQIVGVREPTMMFPDSDSYPVSVSVSGDMLSPPPPAGQLNKAFKFGGRSDESMNTHQEGLTLSDIIPPTSRSVSIEEEDSVMNSILAKATDLPSAAAVPRPRKPTANAEAYRHSRASSVISFTGIGDSFEEMRRGFECHDNRAPWYPSVAAARPRARHGRIESTFSFASVSSYGHVLNPGIPDPFDYGLPSLRERPSSEEMSVSMSLGSVDDTFAFRKPGQGMGHRRVESDDSSFYFNAGSNNRTSISGPPISLYNRSFVHGHRRNESSISSFTQAFMSSNGRGHRRNESSISSVAHAYMMGGANGGREMWAKQHRRDDSVASDFSAMRLGRPGLGDKMFETAPEGLPSISASPTTSSFEDSGVYGSVREEYTYRSDFDSIMDERATGTAEDSLFDRTGMGHRSSMSEESVFGYDYTRAHLLVPNQFRPPSLFSLDNTTHSPMREDDTMISMLGGGHVRRKSLGSIIEASPCPVRLDKKHKHKHPQEQRIMPQPSIASTSSSKFGDERMIRAKRGILERQSLEESVLMAEGEDFSISLNRVPVFSRPNVPSTRSRSSTCTTSSSGADTPPLSASDGSSISGGSQSSIDLSGVDMALANSTYPMSNASRNRIRARARGDGHRRRISEARASRSSVYETIEEEIMSSPEQAQSKKSSPTAVQPVFVVDQDSPAYSEDVDALWNDDRGIVALRRYYDLRDEVEYTVRESKRTWADTAFSLYALQTFQPPRHPAGMQAMLKESVQNYGPLPSDLKPVRRVRTQSRTSPYPAQKVRSPGRPNALQEVQRNFVVHAKPSPSPKKEVPAKNDKNLRPRVGSHARRTALGWSKRSTGKGSTEMKENSVNMSQGMVMMTPGDSLRLSRPRPRGRPTPARQMRV